MPDTPPNEAAADAQQDPAVKIANKASHPFSLDIKVSVFMEIQYIDKHCGHHHHRQVDGMAVGLLLLGLFTRLLRLDTPKNVV